MVLEEVGGVINLRLANPKSILAAINPDWSIQALLDALKEEEEEDEEAVNIHDNKTDESSSGSQRLVRPS